MKEMDKVQVLSYGEARYPDLLAEIKNPPKKLYYIGNYDILKKTCVAVVGSRTTTTYGRKAATAIAKRLAERDVCVVSGMAAGIDSCAHRGVLEARGFTVAVFGCGIDVCYPPENRELRNEIADKGLILSEYPPGTPANRYNFPNRNRIISGLSQMTVVVQARNRSGALITAELAAEQGREVMTLPGNIDSQYNLGNNKLIKDGAIPIISIDDVLEPLGLNKLDCDRAREQLSDTEFSIFEMLLNNGEMSIDEICFKLEKSPAYVNPILSFMEMRGFIFSALGKIFLANG